LAIAFLLSQSLSWLDGINWAHTTIGTRASVQCGQHGTRVMYSVTIRQLDKTSSSSSV
jgi:hypothetical protein